MALTYNWQNIASWSVSKGSATVNFYIDAKLNSQNITGNYSVVDTRLKSTIVNNLSGSGYQFNLTGSAGISGSGVWYFGNETILTGQYTVNHNNDGTASSYISAYVYNRYWSISNTFGATVTLPTIPRVSDISCTSPYVGDSAVVTLTRKASSYRDTVSYKIGTLTGTLATKTANTTVSFDTSTIASDIYNQMGSTAKSINGTMTVQTYSGDTLIGSKSTTFTLYAKESDCVPTITATIVDTNTETIALTGDNNKIVKGYSNARVTYTITTKNGATLSSKTINEATLGSSPYTINQATTNVFSIVATDSRGYSKTLTVNKILIDYVPLSLDFTAFRLSPTGSEIDVNFKGNYYNGSFGSTNNSLSLSWKYRLKDAQNWTTGGTFVLNTDYKISGNTFYSGNGSSASDIVLSNSLFPYDKIYEIGIFYEDQLLSYSTVKAVPKGQPVVNWNDDEVQVNGNFCSTDGFYSTGEGKVNIPTASGNLVIKKANITADNTPNNGVVLEYGNSTNWTGQLYIGDNATQGVYYNGWSNGTRGSWKRLAMQDDLSWKSLGSKTGSEKITLPSSFNELLCVIKLGGVATGFVNVLIPYNILTTSEQGFSNGYYANGQGQSARGEIVATKTQAWLAVGYQNNINVLSSTTTYFYYR